MGLISKRRSRIQAFIEKDWQIWPPLSSISTIRAHANRVPTRGAGYDIAKNSLECVSPWGIQLR
jgi:hypothetical protein